MVITSFGRGRATIDGGTGRGIDVYNAGGIEIRDLARTSNQAGTIIPAEITVFEDNSFTFVIKTPPAPELIRKAAGIDKGSSRARHEPVGTIAWSTVREIATTKQKDLNAASVEAAMRIIEGTARSMGVNVVDEVVEQPEEEPADASEAQ